MKVLITGGAGFIGSHLSDRLLARGDRVLVIDNYATGSPDNLGEHPNLTVVEGTIADPELVARCFDEFSPDVVVHAAASYKDPENWAEDARTNVVGTSVTAAAARAHGAKRLIYFQTSLCYGLHPLEQPITLGHPIRPALNSYAISKTAGERYVMLSGLDYISFRLANAYGPRNVSGPLPTFYQRLTQELRCFVTDTRRDFIYIDDVVDLVLRAVDGGGESGPYHVASGSDTSIKELFDAAVEALGIKLDSEVEVRPRTPDDTYTLLIDPSKTARDFGWQTTTPLRQGVRAAVEWYQKRPVRETFTHLKLPGTTPAGR